MQITVTSAAPRGCKPDPLLEAFVQLVTCQCTKSRQAQPHALLEQAEFKNDTAMAADAGVHLSAITVTPTCQPHVAGLQQEP